ncbi:uncharacterized protein LOC121389345 [Gigantopelta aegis]|uniref:uncharacterized protein LOC121389345 n=1 Tax=Gigantopelta aegis TaxID=1735272 RepID=UPI001B88A49C|nr:uncharacterized protein LOC121389345 [Gigantopelta aegis]
MDLGIYKLFFFFGAFTIYQTSGKVFELNKSNFATFKKSSRFSLVFVDSNNSDCTRCRQMFPFFTAASQNFEEDRDISFGRVHGYTLINSSLTHQLPAVYYYPPDAHTAERMYSDITVDNIMETIANNMYGYFGDTKKTYAIDVNEENFDEIVHAPIQYVMLLLYDKATDEIVTMINEVAEAFRYDDEIIFCKLNADRNKEFADKHFKYRTPPKIFWYHFKLKEEKKSVSRN